MKLLPAILLALSLLLSPFASAAEDDAIPSGSGPDVWAVEFHTSALWSVGGNASHLNYVLLPQLIVLKAPSMWQWHIGSAEISIRPRTTLEISPIVKGPESWFGGITFAPSIEYWNQARTFSAFLSAGGGFGWMDSQGHRVPGGQGQDFNATWFIHSGLCWQLTDRLSATLGARYQHISNRGRNDINPGIDALGPTLGVSWVW